MIPMCISRLDHRGGDEELVVRLAVRHRAEKSRS